MVAIYNGILYMYSVCECGQPFLPLHKSGVEHTYPGLCPCLCLGGGDGVDVDGLLY